MCAIMLIYKGIKSQLCMCVFVHIYIINSPYDVTETYILVIDKIFINIFSCTKYSVKLTLYPT